jgi:hypothetical protein
MDGFGELFRGIAELFGERAAEGVAESGDDGTGDEAREAYVRVLAGARQELNINDR